MLENPYFWVALAFLIFVGIVVKMAGKTITDGLDARADRIRQELEQAQQLREDAQAALAQYQRRQRDALKEAEDILRAAKEDAERIRQRATVELQQSLKRREQQAVDKIAQAEAQALQQVRELVVDVSVAATEKLLVQNLDAQRNDQLVDAAIQDIQGKLH